MSSFNYGPESRGLQDRFDSRRLADALVQIIVHEELNESDCAFIGSRDMLWLATVDTHGQPTVSYKGGAPGFVRILDPRTLVFPCFDGNGMFYSMGNVASRAHVGLLFMDFEHPHRLRVQGDATLSDDPELLGRSPGAQFAVRVAITAIFQNCPRYVHRMQRVAPSRYVPDANGEAPMAGWKRIDKIQPVLPACDQGRAQREGGLYSQEDYEAMAARGDPAA